jgi:hypothetical protein
MSKQKAVAEKKSILPFWPFRRKQAAFVRRYSRHECFVIGTLVLPERRLELDGVIMEISIGGTLFRPATRFILDRSNEDCIVVFNEMRVPGRIMATRTNGYGIRLMRDLDPDFVEETVSHFGLRRLPAA